MAMLEFGDSLYLHSIYSVIAFSSSLFLLSYQYASLHPMLIFRSEYMYIRQCRLQSGDKRMYMHYPNMADMISTRKLLTKKDSLTCIKSIVCKITHNSSSFLFLFSSFAFPRPFMLNIILSLSLSAPPFPGRIREGWINHYSFFQDASQVYVFIHFLRRIAANDIGYCFSFHISLLIYMGSGIRKGCFGLTWEASKVKNVNVRRMFLMYFGLGLGYTKCLYFPNVILDTSHIAFNRA